MPRLIEIRRLELMCLELLGNKLFSLCIDKKCVKENLKELIVYFKIFLPHQMLSNVCDIINKLCEKVSIIKFIFIIHL